MEIETVKKMKSKLEEDIQELVNKFINDTGLPVEVYTDVIYNMGGGPYVLIKTKTEF